MTIFALCCFGEEMNPNPDAATEALRAVGYKVFRLPLALKMGLEIKGDDFVEVRGKGNDEDEDARDAMEAHVGRIVSRFGGAIDPSGARTIAEMFAPLPAHCAHCMELGTPDRPLLKIRVNVDGDKHRALLHSECLKAGVVKLLDEEPIPF